MATVGETTAVPKRLRMLAVALGLAIPAISAACLISHQPWLEDTVGRFFYPGLLASLFLMRTVSVSSLVVAFLLNVILYVLGFFLMFRLRLRWRRG
jgi:hypothetical protein